jgi:hypothetical protein
MPLNFIKDLIKYFLVDGLVKIHLKIFIRLQLIKKSPIKHSKLKKTLTYFLWKLLNNNIYKILCLFTLSPIILCVLHTHVIIILN